MFTAVMVMLTYTIIEESNSIQERNVAMIKNDKLKEEINQLINRGISLKEEQKSVQQQVDRLKNVKSQSDIEDIKLEMKKNFDEKKRLLLSTADSLEIKNKLLNGNQKIKETNYTIINMLLFLIAIGLISKINDDYNKNKLK